MTKHRKPTIVGNWKMNGTRSGANTLLKEIKNGVNGSTGVEVVVLPPFVFLEQTEKLLSNSPIIWGAQNLYAKPYGAYTGEIAASMLTEFNCSYVLIGHSERRLYFHESDSIIAEKYSSALMAGLKPILCVGETADERKSGITYQIISCQLNAIFALAEGVLGLEQTIIAYEPIWAIGSGVTATPEQSQEVHSQIRDLVAQYDKKIANNLRILYGGSVKRSNAAALFAMPDIDGFLIGGASLDAQEFLDIIHLCNS